MNMVAKTDRGRIRESNQDAYFVGEMPDGTVMILPTLWGLSHSVIWTEQ